MMRVAPPKRAAVKPNHAGLPLSQLVSGASNFVLNMTASGVAGTDPVVWGVALHEPGVATDYRGRIVLVTSRVPDRYSLGQLVEESGTAAALVLPPDATKDASLVAGSRPTLLRRSPWASWADVFGVLSRLLDTGATRSGDFQVASLRDLANQIARATEVPVTIEDMQSHVLAYSVRGHEVDSVRNQTILEGMVPSARVEQLMASGFLPAIWRADDAIVREAEGDDPARMVVAVKSGESTLGTIWAALRDDTDRDLLRSALLDARAAAAYLLERAVNRSDHERRMSESALLDLLRTGLDPSVSTAMLGLDPERRHCVVAFHVENELAEDVSFNVQIAFPGSATASTSRETFVIAPVAGDVCSDEHVAETLRALLARALSNRPLLVAVGPVVDHLHELHRSTAAAKEILAAAELRAHMQKSEPHNVLAAADVDDELFLIRAAAKIGADALGPVSPTARLRAHDLAQGSDLTATVSAVLRHPGNLAAAARALKIHSNSLRYRLERIRSISGIDLDDPRSRLRVELELLIHAVGHYATFHGDRPAAIGGK